MEDVFIKCLLWQNGKWLHYVDPSIITIIIIIITIIIMLLLF